MVVVKINGEKKDREFQNMAQALAFVYQNGECYAAEKVEILNTVSKPKKAIPEQPDEVKEPVKEQSVNKDTDVNEPAEPEQEAEVENTAQI